MSRRIARAGAGVAAVLLGACAAPDPGEMFAAGGSEEARLGYLQALDRTPGSPIVHYDLGATGLRLREFEGARAHLEIAATTGDAGVRQWAFYNVGNSHLEPVVLGLAEDRVPELARAIVAYKRALLLDPGDEDAKWNLELARRLLEQELRSPQPRPRQDPEQGGGGGAGGGGGSDTDPGSLDPQPRPAAGTGRAPRLSRAEAEQVLETAEDRELGLQREKLTRPQPARVEH